ncbi:acyloxyacyl hydrolase [Idiomarina xiamenensis]|uniref:Lipid A deacylase n=1 Tax=Idiomarina xiamenensis 10-D-4 TaxID=740709 RepID=K2JK96_9GAMM|nr:acyloxyacyl hydrolase [Idiomarina xiamenensis]EKE83886.1 hypothetical protein A10D4_07061 [Idiomarina xiamenensis 10-D-4]
MKRVKGFRTLFTAAALASASLAVSGLAQADEIQLGGFYSPAQIAGARLGYRFDALPLELPDWTGKPKIFFEGSLNSWYDHHRNGRTITAVAMSPVFQWQISDEGDPVFIEAGIGATLIDGTRIRGRDLSSHYQFEDRIGISWQYDPVSKARLTLSYFHYSNADLQTPNDGLDFVALNWNYPL